MRGIVLGVMLGALFAPQARAKEQVIPAHHRDFSLPSEGRFSPLLRKRFVAKCRMGSCFWLRLESARLIGRSSNGELFAVSQRWWISGFHKSYSEAAMLKFDGSGIAYVFCSKTRPAIIHEDGKTWPLYPGTNSVSGVSERLYVLYWAACHRTATLEAGMDAELAKRFGYKLPKPKGDEAPEVLLQSPRDALNW